MSFLQFDHFIQCPVLTQYLQQVRPLLGQFLDFLTKTNDPVLKSFDFLIQEVFSIRNYLTVEVSRLGKRAECSIRKYDTNFLIKFFDIVS